MPHHLTTTPALSTRRCDAPYHLKPGAKKPGDVEKKWHSCILLYLKKLKTKSTYDLSYHLCLKSLAGPWMSSKAFQELNVDSCDIPNIPNTEYNGYPFHSSQTLYPVGLVLKLRSGWSNRLSTSENPPCHPKRFGCWGADVGPISSDHVVSGVFLGKFLCHFIRSLKKISSKWEDICEIPNYRSLGIIKNVSHISGFSPPRYEDLQGFHIAVWCVYQSFKWGVCWKLIICGKDLRYPEPRQFDKDAASCHPCDKPM